MTPFRNVAMWVALTALLLLSSAVFTVLNWRVAPDAHSSRRATGQQLCIAHYQLAHDRAQDQIILAYVANDDAGLVVASDALTAALHDLSQIDVLCR